MPKYMLLLYFALVLTCFRLTNDGATYFRSEIIVVGFLHLVVLLFKVLLNHVLYIINELSHHTLLEISVRRFTKNGENLGQKTDSIRRWNIISIFGVWCHYVSTTEINFTMVWWNLVPNVGKLFHHFTEAAFWLSFLPCFGKTMH